MHKLLGQHPNVLQSPELSDNASEKGKGKDAQPSAIGLAARNPGSSSSLSSLSQLSHLSPGGSTALFASGIRPSSPPTSPRQGPSRRTLSTTRTRKKSDSKGKCRDETAKPPATEARGISRADSMFSRTSSGGGRESRREKPSSVWSTDDSFLPRAKPPPPLKPIHRRNRSVHTEHTVSTTHSQSAKSTRPTPPYSPRSSSSASGPSSSRSRQEPSTRSWRPSSEAPVLDISSEHNCDNFVADVERALTPPNQHRMTAVSELSEVSEIGFAPAVFPSNWKWMPPSDWAGPSEPESGKENDDMPKVIEKEDEPGSADSNDRAKDGNAQVFTRPNKVQSRNTLKRIRSPIVEKPEDGPPVVREGHLSSEFLRIRCFEGNRWHEKRMADVIPILRKLRTK